MTDRNLQLTFFFCPSVPPNHEETFEFSIFWPKYFYNLYKGIPDDMWIGFANGNLDKTIDVEVEYYFSRAFGELIVEKSGFSEQDNIELTVEKRPNGTFVKLASPSFSPQNFERKPRLIFQKI